jgi:hypothetical protein
VDKRLRWFDEGAPMLRLVLGRLGLGDELPAGRDYYACPCCLVGYPREAVRAGILTEEHVPPQGLGGRGLLLTCVACNSNSGTNFDAHAVRRSDADNFVRGRVDGRVLPMTSYADEFRCAAQPNGQMMGSSFWGCRSRITRKCRLHISKLSTPSSRAEIRALTIHSQWILALTRRALGFHGFVRRT